MNHRHDAESVLKVLVCDDDRVIRKLIEMVIGRRGGQDLVTVDHPDRVIAAALEHEPDIIVLDFVLPDRNGLDVVEELRSHPDLVSTPVAFMTGREDVTSDERYHTLGVAGVIVKPFDTDTLVDRLRTLAAR